MWANLADVLYQVSRRRGEAQKLYDRAIDLALQELRLNAKDPDTVARLAYYYARVGNIPQSRSFVTKVSAIATDSFYAYYCIALAQIEERNLDGAIDSLEKAVELGYSVQLVRIGPEFAQLRGHTRFQRLVASRTRPQAG